MARNVVIFMLGTVFGAVLMWVVKDSDTASPGIQAEAESGELASPEETALNVADSGKHGLQSRSGTASGESIRISAGENVDAPGGLPGEPKTADEDSWASRGGAGPIASSDVPESVKAVEEIAPLLDQEPSASLHRDFELEKGDDSWSPYMEQQIAAYLNSKQELSAFNVAFVGCRTSMCEIHVVGYGPDAYAIWTAATSDMIEQPWCTFTGMSAAARYVEPGTDIIGILVILHSQDT